MPEAKGAARLDGAVLRGGSVLNKKAPHRVLN